MVGAIELLEDREAIAELVRTYARAVDLRRLDVVRDCFAPDLHVVDWWGVKDMGRDETMTYISGVKIFRSTMHMMGNQLVHVDGDRATATTRAMLTHSSDGTDERNEHSPIYDEQLERRDGRWVIVVRGGERVTDVPVLPTSDDPAVQWLLDRAAVADALAASGFTEPPTFTGGLVGVVDGEPVALDPPDASYPATDDPRVRRLIDLAALRDLTLTPDALVNNQQVDLDGDRATVTSYAYRLPDWGRAPEVWTDTCERTEGGWRRIDRLTTDNRMPDELVT